MKETRIVILSLMGLLTACVSQPVSLPSPTTNVSSNSTITINPTTIPSIPTNVSVSVKPTQYPSAIPTTSSTAYPLPENTDYNRRIVYISNFDNNYKITSVNSDGTQEKIVTYLDEMPVDLFSSLDGKKVYYITGDSISGTISSGNSQLYSINIDGSDKKVLFKDNVVQSRITVSRDRKKIIFIKNVEKNNLILFDTETQKSNLLNVNAVHANFSPDNSKIVFNIEKKVKLNNEDPILVYQLYTMNSDGTNIKQITNDNNSYNNPQWLPDGSKIVINYSNTAHQSRGIYSMNPDGTDLKLVIDKTDKIIISPNGEKIAYNLGNSLYISDIKGENSIKIMDKGFVSENGWSLDSNKLLVKNEQLNIVNADGTSLKPISPKDIYVQNKVNPELHNVVMSVTNMSW